MQTFNITWMASLSNGEVFYEGKPPFEERAGERMPFARLINYALDNKVKITSLSLLHEKTNTVIHLPGKGKNPRFREFSAGVPVVEYDVVRKIGANLNDPDKLDLNNADDLYTVGMAYFGNYTIEVWVNEHNPKNIYTLIREVL